MRILSLGFITSNPLQWASLARMVLISGLLVVLKDSSDGNNFDSVVGGLLNVMLSLCIGAGKLYSYMENPTCHRSNVNKIYICF